MKFSSNQQSKYFAFTLIEFLVVAFIIVVLSVILLANYEWGGYQSTLKRSAHQVAGDLRRTEGLAISPELVKGEITPSGYGVFFTTEQSDSYILFADKNGNNRYDEEKEEEIEIVYLPDNIIIQHLYECDAPCTVQMEPKQGLNILFVPPDPEILINNKPDYDATITLLSEKTNEQSYIYINSAGLIEVTTEFFEGAIPPPIE